MADIVTRPWKRLSSLGWRPAPDSLWPELSGMDFPPDVNKSTQTLTNQCFISDPLTHLSCYLKEKNTNPIKKV